MAKEAPQMSYEEFAAHIREETDKANKIAYSIIEGRPDVRSVGCVDKLTAKGTWNPPGGVIFLFHEGLLLPFMEKRIRQNNGQLMAHLNCGYMRVILGADTIKLQRAWIDDAIQKVHDLNHQLGTHFRVPAPEGNGSAAPYMRLSSLFSFK